MSSSGSPQAKLVREWLEAFERMDIELLTKPLHVDFRYATYPRSLNMPEQTRDEWRLQIAATISFWTHMDASLSPNRPLNSSLTHSPQRTVHSITEAPGKVILHVCIPNALTLHPLT